MLNRFAASVSTLALLVGFVGAPHTHLHVLGPDAASDSGHAHAVLHSHTTNHTPDHGHEHGPADADADPRDADGLSVDAFVFQTVKHHALTDGAVVLPRAVAPPTSTSVWTSVDPSTPPHYGSPPIRAASSRAPPTSPSRTV